VKISDFAFNLYFSLNARDQIYKRADKFNVVFKALTAVGTVFWAVMPCSFETA
jgi:hypothetical protein